MHFTTKEANKQKTPKSLKRITKKERMQKKKKSQQEGSHLNMFHGTELPVLGDFFCPRTPYDTAQKGSTLSS